MKFEGVISRDPVVLEKVIFSSLELDAVYPSTNPIELVLFKRQHSKTLIDTMSSLKAGDRVTVVGRGKTNPLNGQDQFILDDIIIFDADAVIKTEPGLFIDKDKLGPVIRSRVIPDKKPFMLTEPENWDPLPDRF